MHLQVCKCHEHANARTRVTSMHLQACVRASTSVLASHSQMQLDAPHPAPTGGRRGDSRTLSDYNIQKESMEGARLQQLQVRNEDRAASDHNTD